MRTPSVSVVLTIFKEESLLIESIDSVLNQTYQDFEIVLVDNNANDTTRQIAQAYISKYPEKIRLVHEPVQGICSAKNRGILESRGEFIAHHDGDDRMKPERLEKQFKVIQSNPSLSLVTGHFDRLSYEGNRILEKNVVSPTTESQMWRDLEKAFSEIYIGTVSDDQRKTFSLSITPTMFFPRKVGIDAGLYDTRLNPRWCEDYEFQTRLFSYGPFDRIKEPILEYRTPSPKSQSEKMVQVDLIERLWQDQRFFSILYENFNHQSNHANQALKRIHAIWLRSVALHLMGFENGKKHGIRLLRRAFLANPKNKEILKLFLKTWTPSFLWDQLFWVKETKGNLPGLKDNFSDRFLPWPPIFPKEINK